ncbi:hypothetical protein DSL64_04100 [Dyadobacter luteus]|jgi:hypothetical protein|uniref:Uncharacterized protein n=1 Tax=Dyadobacter luteus TaxID=2259619 RepID=A0A3D8YIS1_9BACT|nr:hypothetical protein [Dyadobacter luteus]REA63630.1 hypothetical protein DSL64_04100 [Dyadobacter luteus]
MFYQFNAHKHTPPNRNRTVVDHGKYTGRQMMSALSQLQDRWIKFTDIHKGGLPKILLALIYANLGCGYVLAILCMILIARTEPTDVLPIPDRISMPAWSDAGLLDQSSEHLTEFELYLDSLEKQLVLDSINHLQTIKK